MNLFSELRRRNVFRVGMAYAVAAWLVAQVVQLASEAFVAPDWIMKMLIVFLVIGLPAVLFFAWAYELTPEGLKRESEIDREGSITHETGKRLNYVTIALVIAAVVVVLADRHFFDNRIPPQSTAPAMVAAEPPGAEQVPAAATDRSIAVLPFVNMSDDPENEYFADGLAEELLNRLAQLPELRVTGRTSAFQYKGRNLDLRTIASELGVAHVLEGSVRRSGEQVRITAQLIRASDGFHLWSQTYDHTLEDVFRTQDEIAESVAANLDVLMDEQRREIMRRVGVRDVGAFIAYQKAWKKFVDAHSSDDVLAGLRAANEQFRKATDLYPTFGQAWYWQTDLQQHILFAEDSTAEELAAAAAENERLLDEAYRNAQTPEQGAFTNLTRAIFSNDWRNLQALLERARDLQSCAGANWSELTAPFGREREYMEEMRKYIDCQGELRSVLGYERLHEALMLNGKLETALASAEEALAKFGQNDQSSYLRAKALLALGRHEEALQEARLLGGNAVREGHVLAVVLAVMGRLEEAEQAASAWQELPGTRPGERLELYAALGRAKEGRELAARLDARPAGHTLLAGAILGCLCGPLWDLADTPNFKARLDEAGLTWPPAEIVSYPGNPW